MDDKICVLIKAANQSISDLKIECQLDWTVLHLKERIFQLHPVTPSVSGQRLIYSGHLLQDASVLKIVLKYPNDDNVHIVHLVCPTAKIAPEEKQVNSSHSQPTPSPPASSGNVSHTTTTTTDTTTGARRRNVGSTEGTTTFSTEQPFMNTASFQPYVTQFPTFSTFADPIQQMATVQQMYAQYMASYMHYMQTGGVGTFIIPQDMTQPPTTTPSLSAASLIPPQSSESSEQRQQGLDQPNEQQVIAGDGNQQVQQNNQDQRLNAQVIEDEEEEEVFARDWLDRTYFGFRMFFILCIAYFNSTLRRFVFVISTSILLYLYQTGWFRVGRQDGEHRAPDADAAPVPAQGAEGAADPGVAQADEEGRERDPRAEPSDSPTRRAGTASLERELPQQEVGSGGEQPSEGSPLSAEEEHDADPQSSPERQPEQSELEAGPNFVTLVWTFFSSFFLSLIPDRQQQII